jgi:hypothetical protein
MTVEDFFQLGDQPPPLRFLLIGGLAVGFHGYSRFTEDVDFLVSRPEADRWIARIEAAGLATVSRKENFAQFTQTDGMGLDLMFVSDETFEKMWTVALKKDFRGKSVKVVSLEHLLALKLHALKQKLPHRTFKDAEAVEQLARKNLLDLNTPEYEALFLKYGSREIYEMFLGILRH